MENTTKKSSAYDKRKFLNGIPAPIEQDSDFEYDPLPQEDQRPKKRKRGSGGKKPNKRPTLRKKYTAYEYIEGFPSDGDVTEDSDDEGTFPFGVPKFISERRRLHVPLATYFKYHGQSEDETEIPKIEELIQEKEDEEEENADDESEDKSAPSSPVARKKRGKKRVTILPEKDDSATESDSEPEPKTITLPKKRNLQGDSSATESDELMSIDARSPQDSNTEDDDESQIQRRPDFSRSISQRQLCPMVLDAEMHVEVPGPINAYLRDYQRDGVKFLWNKYKNGMGGLLGDDMGLGKTIQIISFLSAVMKKTGYSTDEERRNEHVAKLQSFSEWRQTLPPANGTWPTALIIAPSSVAMNWQREFEKWGFFEVGMYTSKPTARAEVLKDFKLGRLDVVITTFELARDDIDKLCDLAWSCIIVDEVHRLKNPKASTTKKLNMFDCPIRLGLTGTAIQNNYMELWTILDWTNPGALGTPAEWSMYVTTPLTIGQSKGATDLQRVVADKAAKALTEQLLPKFFLRRTKGIIMNQLPTKFDKVVFCPLTSNQITVYKRFLDTPNVQNMLRRSEYCECGSKVLRQKCCHPMDVADIFRYMSTMMKISNHLALILPAEKDNHEQRERNREISRVAFGPNPPLWGAAIYQPSYCGKWLVLETLLQEWHRDKSNKVLIFTKSVKLLEILQYHVESQNWSFERLDGNTDQSERMPKIDRFHQDPDVWIFLISTLAGGTGLNLVGANKVVIFDPNWNPAHDLQAIDRAFRIGQSRDVEVFRFLGAGSIEELMYARQVYKQQQMKIGYEASVQTRYFDGVQNNKDKQGELFGLQNIFKLHENLATKKQIEDANMENLDWALAHMDTKGKAKLGLNQDIRAVEKQAGELDGNDFSGLASFLFEDVPLAPAMQDAFSDALRDIGVEYSHIPDEVLKENVSEKDRIREAEEKYKNARRKNKKGELPSWPPKRRHHKILTPEDRLSSRREALIGLGFIKDPEDLALFAQTFAHKSGDDQKELLMKLDQYCEGQHPAGVIPSFVDPASFRTQ